MGGILEYIGNNMVVMSLLLAAVLVVIIIWNLYLKEKRRAAKIEESVLGERKFYGVFAEENREFYLCIRKRDLKILYVSPNFETMTGLTTRSLYMDIECLKGLTDQSRSREIIRELSVWEGDGPAEFEVTYHRAGETVERQAALSVEALKEQEVYLVSCRDITEEYEVRRQIQKELAAAQKESQSKTDFLSQMSHEIRTPMNGIIGMLKLIRVHINERDSAENYLNKIEELSQFLLHLINDILDMSRIESGKMKLEKVPFDLFALADKLDTMFRSTAEDKGIHWKVEMQDFDVRYVVGDEMRLSQVLINFISNANKFTQAGGSVTVTFRQMDKLDGELHLMISVRDTGKGIKEDFVSKIFRPFEQEDASTAHNYGGSGLGMAIADSIIRLMQGQILVESEEGKGTQFTVYITLPVAEQMDNAVAGESNIYEAQMRQKAIDEFSMKGIRILMAEDNDINAEIAMEILTMEGAIVTRACDGKEVVQMFADSRPGDYDVILMDIQMPEMDGWEATSVIRNMQREDSDILIFAMSANAFVEDSRHSKEVGMNGHINKPVDYEKVRRIIGEQMCTRRSS